MENFDDIYETTEVDLFGFDFTSRLKGATIDSVTFTMVVLSGTDASVNSRVIGSASTDGGVVAQKIGTCLAGVTYRVKAAATLSDSRVLLGYGRLKCVATPSA